ncbi:protein translocase subunit SecD [Parvibaculum sp.]|jgi:protein-export membrane protein SecD|uniref:protein translocase subunit SecD n=1 Tax=Parvibaculum sp. TaxID=2024848 RepID=UPI000C64BE9E|nr:protein translocase subunit SecD [Parvibaculum sp.]HAC59561.1 protein translocase subunit SecD [Rhodobiaceae bacterium]MAU60377.1 protein translocase subunit SecD [Parvibaculum sp.]MBO6669255.1 protein translocase subunit SecD [Parvibaculum sp.]MBO6693364.1 protein translocase subunit SecD [Parvibaculum sp.]MBO6712979.1 protein translocase subunit SecD [Parvibaculum sp.]|tara:strand:- start:2865 stop:4472 length:1608 start_codon:yes stop_codon:yes gene_type:complete
MLHFDRWKIVLIYVLCIAGLVYTAPNFIPKSQLNDVPDWLPNQQINLGLDLRGGSYLLLGLETDALVRERLQDLVNEVRSELRDESIPYTGLGIHNGQVVVNITNAADAERAREAIDGLSSVVAGNQFSALPERDLLIDVEGQTVSIGLSEAAKRARVQSAVQQSIEIVRRRIDELGTTEPVIQQQGVDRILVQVPGLDDPRQLKALLGKTAKMNFRLVSNAMSGQQALATRTVPAGTELLYTADEPKAPVLVERRIMVGGDRLTDAQPGFDQQNGQPVVNFKFDSTGARQFGEVTRDNVGRPFAIVLDNEVISAPVIREPIMGGQGQISGNFTVQEANNLAILLRSGALPVAITVLEERTVGPGLGADSIRAGEVAAIIGSIAVVAFMIASYGFFGVLANIALILNIAMIFAVLSVLQATLTLPGIAGIVLTIGMAVDANVLIYERIREEVAAGKGPIPAIEAGYNRALSSILDANITTLISAAILFQMGSGPVRGFAVTLAIGIVTSVFTAFTVNRYMVSVWLRRRRPKTITL